MISQARTDCLGNKDFVIPIFQQRHKLANGKRHESRLWVNRVRLQLQGPTFIVLCATFADIGSFGDFSRMDDKRVLVVVACPVPAMSPPPSIMGLVIDFPNPLSKETLWSHVVWVRAQSEYGYSPVPWS